MTSALEKMEEAGALWNRIVFLASIVAVIVSIISLKYSNKVVDCSGYLSTITASPAKKQCYEKVLLFGNITKVEMNM